MRANWSAYYDYDSPPILYTLVYMKNAVEHYYYGPFVV